jgi:hypothetical protein
VIPGSGRYYDTIRSGGVHATRVRAFDALDGSGDIGIRLVEWVGHGAAVAASRVGLDARVGFGRRLQAPGAVVMRSGRTKSVQLNVAFARGRVEAEILFRSNTVRWPEPAVAVPPELYDLVAQWVDLQYGLMTESGELAERISLKNEQRILLAVTIGALVVIQIVIACVAALRDPMRRERRLERGRRPKRRRRSGTGVRFRIVDVSRSARRSRVRARAGALLRNAFVIAVIVAMFYLDAIRATSVVQLAYIAGAAVLVSCVEVMVGRVHRRGRFRASYGVLSIVARLTVTVAAICIAAVGAVLAFVPLVTVNMIPPDMTPAEAWITATGSFLAGVALIGFAGVLGRLGARIAARDSVQRLANDRRPEILFLRSFMDDGLRVQAHRTGRHLLVERLVLSRAERFEEILAWQVWTFGPAVTLAQPGQLMTPLGMARLVATDDNWLDVVDEKIATSQFVVMSIGRTPAVLMEVQRIRAAGALARTLFVLPPVPAEERHSRLRLLWHGLSLDPALLPQEDDDRYLLGLSFDSAGRPTFVVGDGNDDLTYQVAVNKMASRLVGYRPPPLHAPADNVHARNALSASDIAVAGAGETDRNRANRADWTLISAATVVGIAIVCGVPAFLGYQVLTDSDAGRQPGLPGPVMASSRTYAVAAGSGDTVEFVDAKSHALVRVAPDGSSSSVATVEGNVTHVVSADRTYVASAYPHRITALAQTLPQYTPIWTTKFDAPPWRITTVGTRLFVTLPRLDRVDVLDSGTGARVATIATGRAPLGITSLGTTVLVANGTDSTVTSIDANTLIVVRSVTVDGALLETMTQNEVVVVSVLDSTVSVLDARTGEVKRSTAVPRPTGEIAVTETHLALPTYEEPARVRVLDRYSLVTVATHPMPAQVTGVATARGRFVCSIPEMSTVVSLPTA